jgi:hypothetical protein
MMNTIAKMTIVVALLITIATLCFPMGASFGRGRGGRGGHAIGGHHGAKTHAQTSGHHQYHQRHHAYGGDRFTTGHHGSSHHYYHTSYHGLGYPYHYYRNRYVSYRYHRHYGFGFLLFPGGYGPYGYYPYRTQASRLVYKEDPAQFGLLKLEVQPAETEIFLNGDYLGRAEALREIAQSVRVGEQQLELRLGPLSRYYRVYVNPGSTSYFAMDLSAEEPYEEDLEDGETQAVYACRSGATEGILKVNVQPGEADVFLNNTLLGKAQSLSEAGIILPEGTHQIRVKAAGHQTYETAVQVSCGTAEELNVTMLKSG